MRKERGNGTLASSSGMNIGCREFGIRALFNAQAAAHQHRNFELHFVAKPLVGLGKNDHVNRARHIFERALRVEVTALRLQHTEIGDDAGGAMVSSLPVDFFIPAISAVLSACRSSSLSLYFSRGWPVMKKPRISFSAARRVCSSQSGILGSLSLLASVLLLLEHAEQAVLAGFGVALRFLRAIHGLVENRH